MYTVPRGSDLESPSSIGTSTPGGLYQSEYDDFVTNYGASSPEQKPT